MTAPARTDWPLVFLLWMAGLLAAAQFARVALSLEPMAVIYPGAPVAFLVSSVAVIGILFGTVAGGLVARFGAPRVTIWALVLSLLTALVQLPSPPFVVLIGLRVIEGAGHLALVVALPTLMASQASDRDRSVVMGLWATFVGVGFALTALAVKVLPSPFALFALHAAGLAIIALLLAPRLSRVEVAAREPVFEIDPRKIYSRPRRVAPGLGHGLYASMFLGLVTFLPAGLDAPWISPILPVLGVVGALGAGLIARMISPDRLVVGGFVLMAAFFALVAVTDGALAIVMAMIAMTVSGVVVGSGFAAVPWFNPEEGERALANGVIAQFGNLGVFVSVPIFAALGAGLAAWGGVVISLISAVAALICYRAARAQSED